MECFVTTTCVSSARVAITATRCAGQSDEDSEVPTRRVLVICSGEGQEGCCVNSHGDRRAGLAAEDLGGFSPWTRCAVSWCSCLSRVTVSASGKRRLVKPKGETGREVHGWIFLFLLTTTIPTLSDPKQQSFLSLFQNFFCHPCSPVLVVDFTVDKCRRSTGRRGGTCWKGVGRVYGLWTSYFSTLKLPCRRACCNL